MYRSSSILLVCLVALFGSAHAKLRGNIDIVNDLQARATNPTLRADIRGKSVRELLGDNYHDLPQEKDRRVDAPPTQQKGRRRTHAGRKNRQSLQQQQQPRELSNVQDIPQQKGSTGRSLQQTDSMTRAIQFFTVYDEYGPTISSLGQTAGLNGLIYNMSSYNSGVELTENDVIGALKGSCSVVGSQNDQFCSFEILLSEPNQSFGSVISSGALEYTVGEGGYLIVEASGDAYQQYGGGIMTARYQSIGTTTIVTMELMLG